MVFRNLSEETRIIIVDEMVRTLLKNADEYREIMIEYLNYHGGELDLAIAETLNFIFKDSIFSDEELAELIMQEWDITYIMAKVIEW